MNDAIPVEELKAALSGALGDEEQFRAMEARGKQIIDQAVALKRLLPTSSRVCVTPSLIYQP